MRCADKIGCIFGLLLLQFSTGLIFTVASASEPVTWQRAIDRDDAAAIRRLMPNTDIADTNEKGKSALMSAARLGDLELLEALRDRGLKLTDRSKTGGTSLMYAALGNQLPMIRYIHAEINDRQFLDARSTNGWTALMIAAAKGFDGSVRTLVELGADPSLADAYQWTPLMRAIDNRHKSVVQFLGGRADAQVNAVNENGSTALHIAALKGDQFSAALLLDRPDIMPAITDNTGRNALEIALTNGNTELAELIRRHIK